MVLSSKIPVLLALWVPHHYISRTSASDVLSLEIKWGVYVWFIFGLFFCCLHFFLTAFSAFPRIQQDFLGWFSCFLSVLVTNVGQSKWSASYICATLTSKSSCLWMPPAYFPQENCGGGSRWKLLNRSADDIQGGTKFVA